MKSKELQQLILSFDGVDYLEIINKVTEESSFQVTVNYKDGTFWRTAWHESEKTAIEAAYFYVRDDALDNENNNEV